MQHIQRPDGLPPVNGYSHVTIANGTVYVSGQVPVSADGVVAEGVEAQVEQVFANLEAALRAAGTAWDRVAKLTYYLTDIADLPVVRAVRDRHIDLERPPASSLVQIAALVDPRFVVEVDAIATIDG